MGTRRRRPPVLRPGPPPALVRSVPGLRPGSRASCSRKYYPPQREFSFPPWNISVAFLFTPSAMLICPPAAPTFFFSPAPGADVYQG